MRESGPGVHLPPPLFFALALGAGWLLHRALPLPLAPPLPRPTTVLVAWTLAALWLLLTGWAVATFARAGTTMIPNRRARRLVTHGPYRLTRNPMYLSLIFLFLGASFLVNTLWSVLLLPLAVAVIHLWVIPSEERHLEAVFGEEYRRYRDAVSRWV